MLTDTHFRVDVNPDRSTTVRLSGEIAAATLGAVRAAFESAVGSGPLVVDLIEVAYLDTAAVDLLYEVASERGLELVLGPASAVFPVIRVSGLDRVATIR
jgi:anti-anti-sigma factor